MKNVFDYYSELVRTDNVVEERVDSTESEKMFDVEETEKPDYSVDIEKANNRIAELEKMIAELKKEGTDNAGISESVCE